MQEFTLPHKVDGYSMPDLKQNLKRAIETYLTYVPFDMSPLAYQKEALALFTTYCLIFDNFSSNLQENNMS